MSKQEATSGTNYILHYILLTASTSSEGHALVVHSHKNKKHTFTLSRRVLQKRKGEGSCKGQTLSHPHQTQWRQMSKRKVQKIKKKPRTTSRVFSQSRLTPVPFMLNGLPCVARVEHRVTDSLLQVSLKVAAAAGRGTEVDRNSLKLLYFLQSTDHITGPKTKALWTHWTTVRGSQPQIQGREPPLCPSPFFPFTHCPSAAPSVLFLLHLLLHKHLALALLFLFRESPSTH